MAKIGILGFSFSSHDSLNEPGCCNTRLRRAIERIVRKIEEGIGIEKISPYTWDWYDPDNQGERLETSIVIVVQREIGYSFEDSHSPKRIVPDLIIDQHRISGLRLDPTEVTAQAAELFRHEGVKIVVPVAHPIFCLTESKGLLKQAGFEVLDMPELIGRIGFDPKSNDWWTRGPVRLLWYAILQKFFGYHG